jgi:Na+/H+ antiporter NhaD/arsenite permease-like protein
MIACVFILAYILIAAEEKTKLNKTAIALVAGTLCWALLPYTGYPHAMQQQLPIHLSGIAEIILFLLGAMTIVHLIDMYNGFELITNYIKGVSTQHTLLVMMLIAFVLSAVLDNLTTTILLISMSNKILKNKELQMHLAALVVIAANAGGAWSAIGDVTSTMLWIGGQVSEGKLLQTVLLPSIACIIPAILSIYLLKKPSNSDAQITNANNIENNFNNFSLGIQRLVLLCGMAALLMVPILKATLHLPPYLSMLMGLGVLWLITESVKHRSNLETLNNYTVANALQKIDTPSILFFLGILLCIGALEANGNLHTLSHRLQNVFVHKHTLIFTTGLMSAIIDNVPLVSAVQQMYPLSTYPSNDSFWLFLCYCSGTGGSILIIGSVAGVAAMGLQNISFGWYLKKYSIIALLGYLIGAAVFLLTQ